MNNEWEVLEIKQSHEPADLNLILQQLATNSIAALHVRDFFPEKHLPIVVKNIVAQGISWYPNFENKQGRIGLCATEYASKVDGKNQYFLLEPQHSEIRNNIFPEEVSPIDLLTSFFAPRFELSIAKESFRKNSQYFAGLIRAMCQESTVHFDYAPHQLPGWSVADIYIQLGTVIYLQMPEQGGGLKIYNHQWNLEDDAHNKDTYEKGPEGFDPVFLRKDSFVIIKPDPGDLVIFNTRNFHQVTGIDSVVPRLTCNSFLSMKDNFLHLWN